MGSGKYGTSMQCIETRPPKRGNKECRYCEHLVYGLPSNQKVQNGKVKTKSPYYCNVKNKTMFYTAKLYCKHFKEANK